MDTAYKLVIVVVGMMLLGLALDIVRRTLYGGKRESKVRPQDNELLLETKSSLSKAKRERLKHRVKPSIPAITEPPAVEPEMTETTAAGVSEDVIPEQTEEAPQRESVVPLVKHEEVIAITVAARSKKGFAGKALLEILESNHLHYGDMDIFHRFEKKDGTGKKLFSVSKSTEPGIFNLHKLAAEHITGVTLFFIINPNTDLQENLELMVRTAKQLSYMLNGMLLDHNYQPLTKQTLSVFQKNIDHHKQQVQLI